ncbi:hypothetical protein JCM10213_002637 [Rhodosporidiobolus nylandii]
MLGRLPIELVERILCLAAPADYGETAYKHRRATLRNLCLVDRRMREIAQPLLWEIVAFEGAEQFEALEAAAEDAALAKMARVLHFWQREEHNFEVEEILRGAAGVQPFVEEMGFKVGERADQYFPVLFLSRFTNLHHFAIEGGCRLVFFNLPAPLTLSTLSLSGIRIVPSILRYLLSPKNTPSLRGLYLSCLRDPDNDDTPFLPELEHLPLDRLDVVHLDLMEFPILSASLCSGRSVPFAVILSASLPLDANVAAEELAILTALQPQHLHLNSHAHFAPLEAYPRDLRIAATARLAAFIAKRAIPLKTLTVPPVMASSAFSAAQAALVKACTAAGVEVLQRRLAPLCDDFELGREFLEHVQRKKAAQGEA